LKVQKLIFVWNFWSEEFTDAAGGVSDGIEFNEIPPKYTNWKLTHSRGALFYTCERRYPVAQEPSFSTVSISPLFLVFEKVPEWRSLKSWGSILFLHTSIFWTMQHFSIKFIHFSSKFGNFIHTFDRNEKFLVKKDYFC